MKKQPLVKKAGTIITALAVMAFVQVRAADLAEANKVLAEVNAIASQAQSMLAQAASSGDLKAVSAAADRASAVNDALVQAKQAYAAIEKAIAANDTAAADEAMKALEEAKAKAQAALEGQQLAAEQTVAEEEAPANYDEWLESQKNTGGGPVADSYDAPNIYNVPWQSESLQSVYSSLFNEFWNASAHGGSTYIKNEHEATPE